MSSLDNPDKFAIDPPPTNIQDLNSFPWKLWFNKIYQRIGNYVFGINGVSKAQLTTSTGNPFNASSWFSNDPKMPYTGLIFVYDESGGPTLAFSDGTHWLRVQDRAIVS